MNRAILTLPMMPIDGSNYGKFVTPIICETLSNILNCDYYHCINILDSFNDRSIKIDNYILSLDVNNIHYDKLWYDNQNIPKLLDNIKTLIKNDYIFEIDLSVYRCECGVVEIEKDKIYSEISEKRKAKGIEFHYKAQDATKLQYQYGYIHDQVEGYIHKLPKDWVKSIDVDTDEEYYAPGLTYSDFAIYITYTTVPRESVRKIDDYLYYMNECYDCDINITPYVTEYANGISARFYHKDIDKGIVTFVFKQKNRWACLRFVCSTMDIMEQYNEIIFEVANSFAFVTPTLLSNKSANRTEVQYYNEALYYYNMENYETAMHFATEAIQHGSEKASYLLIELYFDVDSPYRDID